ncbi:MAG: RNA polymerase factor sigma-32 [Polyangiaceae bacterium]
MATKRKKATKKREKAAPEEEVFEAEVTTDEEPEESDEDDGDGDLDDDALAADESEIADEDLEVDDSELEALVAPKKGRAGQASTALSTKDPFQAYIREVQRYPLLTREEEKELTREYVETQDPAIARRLVTANLRLVIKLAYEYRRAYKNMMDLIQEGNIGLMQAVKRYDPYRGVKLSSYSAWWIRAYMLRFILNNWRLVKLGTTQAQRKLFFNLNKQKAKLTAMGIDPSPKVIADRLGVKEREVVEMDRRMSSSEASLDAPLGDSEGRSVARVELMPSDQKSTDDKVASQQLGELLNEHLSAFRERLDGKELIIFDKRLVAEDPLTLQRLGDEFGVSRERVRQLEARLARRLREYLKAELGDAVDLGV